jgi:hypothetical protein
MTLLTVAVLRSLLSFEWCGDPDYSYRLTYLYFLKTNFFKPPLTMVQYINQYYSKPFFVPRVRIPLFSPLGSLGTFKLEAILALGFSHR